MELRPKIPYKETDRWNMEGFKTLDKLYDAHHLNIHEMISFYLVFW